MPLPAYFDRFSKFIPSTLLENEAFADDIAHCTIRLFIKKGDYLIRTGEICHNGYFINKGLFINQYVGDKGNVCVTGFSSDEVYPFVSVIGYFTQQPSAFEIKAIEDSELLCFSRRDLVRLSANYADFGLSFQRVMLMIIEKLYSMFAVRQTSCSEDFLRYLYEHHKWIINRVPDKYIAQYMGISNSWYCKLKKRLFY